MKVAIFAGGCFWCTEAIFKRLRGVTKVTSGYAGGKRENPSYEQVSSGVTGHAEAVKIEFDPKVISYEKLLEVFFGTHDPTTPNQQGADTGPQYRPLIIYMDAGQKIQAEAYIKKISNEYDQPVITEVIPYTDFYTAEEYHQNFEEKQPTSLYCQLVISPKVQKLLEKYGSYVKERYRE